MQNSLSVPKANWSVYQLKGQKRRVTTLAIRPKKVTGVGAEQRAVTIRQNLSSLALNILDIQQNVLKVKIYNAIYVCKRAIGTVCHIELATSGPYGEAIGDKDNIKAGRDGYVKPKTMGSRERTGKYGEISAIRSGKVASVTIKWVRDMDTTAAAIPLMNWREGGQPFRRMDVSVITLHSREPRKTSRFTLQPLCRSCHDEEEEETVLHLLGTCRALEASVLGFCRERSSMTCLSCLRKPETLKKQYFGKKQHLNPILKQTKAHTYCKSYVRSGVTKSLLQKPPHSYRSDFLAMINRTSLWDPICCTYISFYLCGSVRVLMLNGGLAYSIDMLMNRLMSASPLGRSLFTEMLSISKVPFEYSAIPSIAREQTGTSRVTSSCGRGVG
ncbi:hypothetical protein EVAR_70540_1 [Eumeta japonica]|uniref:Uncharacterized protein n=1 Tax=Eumeta variegata TaxID=151549 RepID=A0A4C1SJ29_EUMVA|nr:hypothetical protein EVAR_70540_1 [Eumeta japonica]